MKKLTVLLVAIAMTTAAVAGTVYANVSLTAPGENVVIEATTAAPAETVATSEVENETQTRIIIIDEETAAENVTETWDQCPYSEELAAYSANMDRDFQNYIWTLAKNRGLDQDGTEHYYAWLIGLAQGEQEFRTGSVTYHTNAGGSVDRGMFQTNSCWTKYFKKLGVINSAEDLYDKYTSAICGDHLGWVGYEIYGWSVYSYSCYLYGDTKNVHDNKKTQRVWKMQQNWYDIIFNKPRELEKEKESEFLETIVEIKNN